MKKKDVKAAQEAHPSSFESADWVSAWRRGEEKK